MNKKLHDRAIALRKSGKSYSEIKNLLNIPKSTLSDWFSREKWSESIKAEINKKSSQKSTARILLMNKQRALNKVDRDNEYLKEADAEYKNLKKDPLFIAGLSIYWGEGEKFGNWRVAIINSDAKMMQVAISFFRIILKVPEDKIRAGLFLYEDLDQEKTQKYWSEMLALPAKQFIKTHVLKSKARVGKKRSVYGMCNIYVCGVKFKTKVMRWIELFHIDIISKSKLRD